MSYKIGSFYQKLVKRIFNSESMDKNDIDHALSRLMELKGSMAASLIDWENDSVLGTKTKVDFDINTASKGNAKVVKANMNTIHDISPQSAIEDILITFTNQTHVIHIIASRPELCLYIALDSEKSSLALARTKVSLIAKELSDKYDSKLTEG